MFHSSYHTKWFPKQINVLIQGLYFLVSSRDTKPLALGIGCNRQGKETCFSLLHDNCLPCDFNWPNIIIIEERESDTYTPCKRVLTSDQSSFPSFQNCWKWTMIQILWGLNVLEFQDRFTFYHLISPNANIKVIHFSNPQIIYNIMFF